MARGIGTNAVISKIRLQEQASNPAVPDSGYGFVFLKSDGLYVRQDGGTVLGPFGVGGAEPFHYVQATDPGAVGAGKYWLNTSGSRYALWRRNATDDDWILIDPQPMIDVEQDGVGTGTADTLDFLTGDGTILTVTANPGNPTQIEIKTLISKIALTLQSADISASSFGNSTNGQYRVTYYLVCTTADAGAGGVTLTLAANDGTAARSFASGAVSLAATNFDSGEFILRVGNTTQPTYAISHTGSYGTAKYALYLTIEPLGVGA